MKHHRLQFFLLFFPFVTTLRHPSLATQRRVVSLVDAYCATSDGGQSRVCADFARFRSARQTRTSEVADELEIKSLMRNESFASLAVGVKPMTGPSLVIFENPNQNQTTSPPSVNKKNVHLNATVTSEKDIKERVMNGQHPGQLLPDNGSRKETNDRLISEDLAKSSKTPTGSVQESKKGSSTVGSDKIATSSATSTGSRPDPKQGSENVGTPSGGSTGTGPDPKKGSENVGTPSGASTGTGPDPKKGSENVGTPSRASTGSRPDPKQGSVATGSSPDLVNGSASGSKNSTTPTGAQTNPENSPKTNKTSEADPKTAAENPEAQGELLTPEQVREELRQLLQEQFAKMSIVAPPPKDDPACGKLRQEYDDVCFTTPPLAAFQETREFCMAFVKNCQRSLLTNLFTNLKNFNVDFSIYCKKHRERYRYVCPDPLRFNTFAQDAVEFCLRYNERCPKEAVPAEPVQFKRKDENHIYTREIETWCTRSRRTAYNYCTEIELLKTPRYQSFCGLYKFACIDILKRVIYG